MACLVVSKPCLDRLELYHRARTNTSCRIRDRRFGERSYLNVPVLQRRSDQAGLDGSSKRFAYNVMSTAHLEADSEILTETGQFPVRITTELARANSAARFDKPYFLKCYVNIVFSLSILVYYPSS
jgi:hypothetical protein